MEYIDSEAEIMEGDEIITSGLSDYYPAGIYRICNGGTSGSERTYKYAVIEPKVDFKHLDTVLVNGNRG